MIPFDGQFAQNYIYPLALGAYNAQTPPPGYTLGTDAFEILADLSPAFRTRLDQAEPKHRKALQSMLDHPRQPRIADRTKATSATVQAKPRSAQPNQHFGWLCVDAKLNRLIVAFRGTEYFKDWLDDFDFAPAPYSAIPGRGTVHQGFQVVYEAVRENLRKLVQSKAPGCKELLITGHSLGGALAAFSAPIFSTTSRQISRRLFTPGPSLASATPISSASSIPASTSAIALSIFGTLCRTCRRCSLSTNTKLFLTYRQRSYLRCGPQSPADHRLRARPCFLERAPSSTWRRPCRKDCLT
jgi:hypothetical protein